jgi:excisionase family DNA binding protein
MPLEGTTNMATAKQPSAETVNSAILTKQEAAELLRCTPRYLERQVRAGRIKALKPTGKFVRFFRHDIDAFLLSGASIANRREETKR